MSAEEFASRFPDDAKKYEFTPSKLQAFDSESRIQQELIRWWRFESAKLGLPEVALFAIPNEGQRSEANGSRMKAQGMRAGVSDLMLAVPRGGKAGLFVELKKKGGTVRDTQAAFQDAMRTMGYAASVCFGLEDAQALIRGYLSLPKP